MKNHPYSSWDTTIGNNQTENNNLGAKSGRRETQSKNPPFSLGDIIDVLGMKCKVLNKITGGGMGEVYLCQELLTEMSLVLKTYISRFEKAMRDTFRWEAEVWVKLGRHPNIVKAIGVEKINNRVFVVLEYVESDNNYGVELRKWIHKGAFEENISLVLDFSIQICNGMMFAEEQFHHKQHAPFVHRDIKPENILVEKDKTVKITDFGTVAAVSELSEENFNEADLDTKFVVKSLPGTGKSGKRIVGTPPYMAPEVWDGLEVDERTDIYSFGCTLYEMIIGRTPFVESSFDEYHTAHVSKSPEPIQGIPDNLNKVILRCLKKKKEKRFLDFVELRDNLIPIYQEMVGPLPEHLEFSVPSSDSLEYLDEGANLERLNKFEEAIQCYQKAIEIDPENPEAYYRRGRIYKTLRLHRQAIKDFSKSVELDPRFSHVYLERGFLYRTLGWTDKATEDFRSFLKCASLKERPLAELVRKLIEDIEGENG